MRKKSRKKKKSKIGISTISKKKFLNNVERYKKLG